MIITDEKILRRESVPTTLKEVEGLWVEAKIKAAVKTGWCDGLGLAAIQVNIPLRMAWYMIPEKDPNTDKILPDTGKNVVLINPVIIEKEGYCHCTGEGCLSIPNMRFQTGRYRDITVRGQIIIDGHSVGEISAYGIEAVVIQHEIDHMDGILCKDRRYVPVQKTGRNDPCPCGSGKKYKKYCL